MATEIEIRVGLKTGMADPEGANVEKALGLLGFDNIGTVKSAKCYRIRVDGEPNEALKQVRVEICSLGIIKTWVGAVGFMSLNARTWSFSYTISPGISPSLILQKRQSSMYWELHCVYRLYIRDKRPAIEPIAVPVSNATLEPVSSK